MYLLNFMRINTVNKWNSFRAMAFLIGCCYENKKWIISEQKMQSKKSDFSEKSWKFHGIATKCQIFTDCSSDQKINQPYCSISDLLWIGLPDHKWILLHETWSLRWRKRHQWRALEMGSGTRSFPGSQVHAATAEVHAERRDISPSGQCSQIVQSVRAVLRKLFFETLVQLISF